MATQTGHESPDLAFNPDKMTTDKHCYECKVRYRDPKPQDLVMYLHAWKYRVSFSFFLFVFDNKIKYMGFVSKKNKKRGKYIQNH